MIQIPRGFKNTDNHKAIELMLTNSVSSFQNSCALETGLYDFDKITGTVFKSFLEKKQLNIRLDRYLRTFLNNDFRTQIVWDFSTLHLNSDYSSLDTCLDICIRALDIYALKKKDYLRVNNSPFMNITISKAVLDCTRLKNKYLKNTSAENRQRNYCVSLTRKSKTDLDNTTILIIGMSPIENFADSTFHRSALHIGCSFNFHFYIY